MQDGKSSGLTAPNGPSQAALLKTVLSVSSTNPSDVRTVSVHGTGTPLGDPIEIGALGQGFGKKGGRQPLHVLSNKSCFGHTEGAAGVPVNPSPLHLLHPSRNAHMQKLETSSVSKIRAQCLHQFRRCRLLMSVTHYG